MRNLILTGCLLLLAFTSGCTTEANSDAADARQTSPDTPPARQGGGVASTPTPELKPTFTPAPPAEQQKHDPDSPAEVIRQYYAAINAKEYRAAYELWSGKGEASKKTYDQFREGFADTESTEVELGPVGEEDAAAGSRFVTIPVTIRAKTRNGKDQNFAGEYVLRRSVVDGATDEQRAWRIHSAKIQKR